jgi:regulator of sigma E protease
MNPVLLAVIVALAFSLIVVVHEAGHFLTAKAVGIRVDQFSVGFGPRLVGVTRGETTYAIRALPLGGFVKLAGMDPNDQAGPRGFNAHPLWQRVLVIVAGPALNLVLPVVLFSAVYVVGSPVQVVSVDNGTPAQAAGLQAQDTIVAVDGHRVEQNSDLRAYVNADGQAQQPVHLQVKRHDQLLTFTISPQKRDSGYVLGVRTSPGVKRLAPPAAISQSVTDTAGLVVGTFQGFYRLATDQSLGGFFGQNGIRGPVGIMKTTADEARGGPVPLTFWIGFLSLSLGLINILPFPALDGGRLAFLIVEGIRGRPVDPVREQMVHYVGLAILFGFIALVTYNDVFR